MTIVGSKNSGSRIPWFCLVKMEANHSMEGEVTIKATSAPSAEASAVVPTAVAEKLYGGASRTSA